MLLTVAAIVMTLCKLREHHKKGRITEQSHKNTRVEFKVGFDQVIEERTEM